MFDGTFAKKKLTLFMLLPRLPKNPLTLPKQKNKVQKCQILSDEN